MRVRGGRAGVVESRPPPIGVGVVESGPPPIGGSYA